MLAETMKYKTLVASNKWEAPTEQDTQLLALTAKLKQTNENFNKYKQGKKQGWHPKVHRVVAITDILSDLHPMKMTVSLFVISPTKSQEPNVNPIH
jgi:hypothetical protein